MQIDQNGAGQRTSTRSPVTGCKNTTPAARFATAAELGDALAAATRSALPDDVRAHGEGLGTRGGWARPTTKFAR